MAFNTYISKAYIQFEPRDVVICLPFVMQLKNPGNLHSPKSRPGR